MKLDILAFGAHPDDVELGCGGTLIKHIDKGYKVGIIDLTRGELGTRGDVTTRAAELEESSKIMGLHVRENLGLADGFFENNKENQLAVIKCIRKYTPNIVIANAVHDRHPDHGRAAKLVYDSVFIAGLRKVETEEDGKPQLPHRPRALYHYIQAMHIQPDLIVDISQQFEQKLKAIYAFKSQFYNSNSNEPNTFISSPEFLEFVKARAIHFGVPLGVKYAEAFTVNRTPGIENLLDLL